jgi:hypothetical protein
MADINPLGGFKKSIKLQTANGTDIPNDQFLEIDDGAEISKLTAFHSKYGTSIEQRSQPSGMYNCHGLTFASRRTWIGDDASLPVILSEDRYDEVPPDAVLPGDIILYFGPDGTVVHSGWVVTNARTVALVPQIVSKWGSSAEFVHWANQSPYRGSWKFFRINR